MMDIKGILLQWIFKFFDKKTSATRIKNENISNKGLNEELDKPNIKTFKKRKVHSHFINNNADMQLISKFNKGICFLLCVLTFIANMHGLFLWKIKKGITITTDFQKVLKESYRKPNKKWVDKGSELYNRSMKSWLEKMI